MEAAIPDTSVTTIDSQFSPKRELGQR